MPRISATNKNIKIALFSRGFYLADVARKAGRCPSYVTEVVNGKKSCPKIEAAIAEMLGTTIDKIPWDKRCKAQRKRFAKAA